MTALELAEKLEQQFPIGTAGNFLDGDAADMLRAQHALIENLQKALREVPNTQLHYADHIRRQHEAIKQLRGALRGMVALDSEGLRGNDDIDICYEHREALQALKDTEGL